VELAVDWFERQLRKDAFRIDRKDYYVRLQNVMEVVERAFGERLADCADEEKGFDSGRHVW
jgi:hypothetical protein